MLSFKRVLTLKQDPNLLPRGKPDKLVSEKVDSNKGQHENLQASSPITQYYNSQRVDWDGRMKWANPLIPPSQPPLIAMAG